MGLSLQKENMKLGIVTFNSVINYGSALQAYAMQEGIAKSGVETEIIDYRPGMTSVAERIKNNWTRLFSVEKWKRFLKRKISAKKIYGVNEERAKRRAKKFQEFQEERFRLSARINVREDLKNIEKDFDAFVCGSDQIWNPTYIGHDMSYYLDFVSNDWKRFAYAPSIAVKEFPEEYAKEIKVQMQKFERISVREKESVEVVESLIGIKPDVVVDPTLLLTAEEWHKIEKAPVKEYIESPYIFCYFLGPNQEYCEYVNKLKELTGCKIVMVTCTELRVFENYGDVICEDIGPAEFVYLIHHADYVCTDSFHGTVFSIINQKRFFTFKRYKDASKSSENSRIYTLLEMVDCSQRLIEQAIDVEKIYMDEIDYSSITTKLSNYREQSEEYIRSEIGRIKKYSK